jgi:DNA polymerase III delta prime subunit
MEMKELNVSEVNTQQAVAGTVQATAQPVAQPAAGTEVGNITAGLAAALKEVLVSAAQEKNVVTLEAKKEIPVSERPIAEVTKGRGGDYKVYLPHDIRMDIHSWDYSSAMIPRQARSYNEYDYLGQPNYAQAKAFSLISGMHIYKHREKFEEYLEEVDSDLDEDSSQETKDFAARAKKELTRVLVELKRLFEEAIGNLDNLTSDSEFSYESLFILLSQSNIPLVLTEQDETCITTVRVEEHQSMFGEYLAAIGKAHVFTNELASHEHVFYYGKYTGKKTLRDLGICPVSGNKELKERLIARGRKYMSVVSAPSYMQYTGELLRKTWRNTTAFRAKGRVMVDLEAMTTMDPNYGYYFGGTGNRDRNSYKAKDTINMTDEVLMTMSPYVYGFSFLSKVWGEMLVDKMDPILFREDAHDKLVMDDDQKDMILALVETQLDSKRADIIDGKGGGRIFLLAGEPGTGKTLTAEVTAEKLKRPLYMVGVGELGTSAAELEGNLRQILDVAASWNAVLLLDECDIFMEARTDSNIQRNAMVGVFLRLLEYYQGIMFLTSNRASNIDKAFYSRISMAINFPSLTTEDRVSIWENILDLNGVELNDAEILYLADNYAVNGRQIKNAVNNATALARRDQRIVEVEDFAFVLDKGIEFQEAVFARGAKNDMTLSGMHHDNPNDEEEYNVANVRLISEDDGAFSRLFRGIGSFFNILGGAK